MLGLGLLILRLVVGLTVAAHGAQKLFGWWNGPGLEGFGGMLGHLGLRPARFWALLAASGEFAGGILTVLGLLHPLGPLLLAGSMLVAIATVHWAQGFWNTERGFEFPLQILGGAVALSLAGSGALALDSALGLALPEPATWIVLAVGTLLVTGAALASPRLPEREKARRPTLG